MESLKEQSAFDRSQNKAYYVGPNQQYMGIMGLFVGLLDHGQMTTSRHGILTQDMRIEEIEMRA